MTNMNTRSLMNTRSFILFLLLCLACFSWAPSASAQTTTLTINSSTGLVNVPTGVTPNFATLKLGSVTFTLPAGAIVGTTDTQTLTNKTLTSPAITTPTGLVKSDVSLGNVSNTSYSHTLTLGNGSVTIGAAGQISAITDPSNLATLADTQTLTNKTIAAASNTLSYARGGSGMATRTLNAEIDESPLTSKGAAAAVDNSTDDTAALQRQLNSKGELRFSMGAAKITDVLTLSTVGQILKGSGIPNGAANGTQINQTVTGKDGIHWYPTGLGGSDVLPDQGAHADFASFRDFSLRTNFSNTGIGMDLGSDTTYSGDYTSLSNLYIEHFETGIHVKSMGLTRWWNVAVSGDSGTPSDYGVKFDGGSSNSHFLIGVSIAHCNVGLDLNTPGQGNVYMLGDMGSNTTHVKQESESMAPMASSSAAITRLTPRASSISRAVTTTPSSSRDITSTARKPRSPTCSTAITSSSSVTPATSALAAR